MTSATPDAPRWVRWWFRGAAIYGAIVLLPTYLVAPPGPAAALTYYGFTGCALAFQLVFWIIGGDPVRYRTVMLAGVPEKLAFAIPAALLVAQGIAPRAVLPFAAIDLLLGIGFLAAWRATPRR